MTDPHIELRLGRWQDVLRDVTECDAVITDPPYSERTHKGALDATTLESGVNGYGWLSEGDARGLMLWADGVARSWVVVHTDDVLHPVFRDAADKCGRYVFPMLPVLQQQPRVNGDGPAPAGHLLAVSRPREKRFLSWGSLPGWYECGRDGRYVRGGKPLWLMRAIIRDYTKPGDLIVDPFVGSGTTLIAARQEGRSCIGAECDQDTYAKAKARIEAPYTPELFR